MSRLEDLIQTLCPDGVEYQKLGDIGTFFGGLTGKTKQDFQDGNRKFISYMNVYKNPAVDTTTKDFVRIGSKERQNAVEYGDILFTGSSETLEECGISSVMVNHPNEPFYLNSFTIGFRLHDPNLLNPDFSKHLFRSVEMRKQINKTANGVTRFNVSKVKLARVKLPLPPLPIQEEIVRILDTFTALETELEAELAARTKQYEHYSHKLLYYSQNSFENISRFIELRDIAHYSKERISAKEIDKTSYVGVDNILQNKKGKVDSDYVPIKGTLIKYHKDDILIGNIRPYLRKIWIADRDGGTNGDVLCLQINKDSKQSVNPKYLFHILASEEFFTYAIKNSRGAKMPRGDKALTLIFEFPLPPLSVQEDIVSILDRFEALVNDLKSGLPAEIALRRKQYEYYRDRLLTFKPFNDM